MNMRRMQIARFCACGTKVRLMDRKHELKEAPKNYDSGTNGNGTGCIELVCLPAGYKFFTAKYSVTCTHQSTTLEMLPPLIQAK